MWVDERLRPLLVALALPSSALERMADATRHTTSLGKVEGVVALDVKLVG
jgi:hypothetical protein